MSWWMWVVVVEYAVLGLMALATAVARARERAALNRIALRVWTRAPMGLSPPTMTELVRPGWILPPRTQPPSSQ